MRAPLLVMCLAAASLGASCARPEPAAAGKPAPSADARPAPSATCPPAIPAAQRLSEAVAGWEPFEVDAPIQLMSVGVVDGHPRERASLVPDSDEESAGRRLAVWQLDKNRSRDSWLVCYYDGTRVALTRALARDITRVEVTSDTQVTIAGHPEVTGIAFK